MTVNEYIKVNLRKDILSSLVVFLVALPLCMGIAIASGVPPILGLLSGIIGGVIVGTFTGCPLQVSGPAAGIAVMVFEFVDKFGLPSMVPLGIIVGLFQLAVNVFKLAEYFKAISPALIKGLLSAIGLLILVSQVHVAFDALPKSSGLQNLIHIPKSFYTLVLLEGGGRIAFGITLLTLVAIVLWMTFAKKLSKILPAPLFAILVVGAGAHLFGLDIKFIDIPANVLDGLYILNENSFSEVTFGMIFAAIAIAFVATAETLLSVTAVDKLSDLPNSNYNQEIKAQGIGNLCAGFLGALPITGVIVRSSANVESGGRTRGATIFHGLWLFALTFFFTDVLALIPVSALAGILIFVGWRLLDPKGIAALFKKSRNEAIVFTITFILIVSVDLLTGVIVGFVASLAVLAFRLSRLEIEKIENDHEIRIRFSGRASFLQVPQVSDALSQDSGDKKFIVDLTNLQFMDLAIEEQIDSWKIEQEKTGTPNEIIR